MFVASVGLLGLAALIPVGGHNIREASRSTRANAVGRAAYREINARGWLQREMLYAPSIDQMRVPFVIDPQFIHFPANQPDLARTTVAPVVLDNDPEYADGSNPPPRLSRFSLRPYFNAAGSINFSAAERYFTNEDDKVFTSADETKRPLAFIDDANRHQSLGEYRWMAVLSPAYTTPAGILPRTYKVSVVVFHKRSLLIPPADITNRTDGPPTERYLYADFISGGVGWGGGDVRLRLVDNAATFSASPDQSDFPRVSPGQWIMLVAEKSNAEVFVEWYRVVSVGRRADAQSGPEAMETATPSGSNEWYLDVTLDGPDWNPLARDPVTNDLVIPDMDRDNVNDFATIKANPTVFAAIFDGVVGVYTKTIEVDSWAMP